MRALQPLHPDDEKNVEMILSRVKTGDLPVLEFPKQGSKAGAFETWLQIMKLKVSSWHVLVEAYWTLVLQSNDLAYDQYLRLDPMNRPIVRPNNSWIAGINYRIELKLRPLLLEVLPATIQQSSISASQTTVVDLMFAATLEAGPGTVADRLATLQSVSKQWNPEVPVLFDALQAWKFQLTRLMKLGVVPPDPGVQLNTLKTLVKKLCESDDGVRHRMYQFIMNHQMHGAVTQAQVDTLWCYLSVEAREAQAQGIVKGQSMEPKGPMADVQFRLAAMEKSIKGGKAVTGKGDSKGAKNGGGKGDHKGDKGGKHGGKDPSKDGGKKGGGKGKEKDAQGKGATGENVCKFFLSDAGCKNGGTCTFVHPRVSPADGKCFNCGSTLHTKDACQRPKKDSAARVADPSTAPGGPAGSGSSATASKKAESNLINEAVKATILTLAEPKTGAGCASVTPRGTPWWEPRANMIFVDTGASENVWPDELDPEMAALRREVEDRVENEVERTSSEERLVDRIDADLYDQDDRDSAEDVFRGDPDEDEMPALICSQPCGNWGPPLMEANACGRPCTRVAGHEFTHWNRCTAQTGIMLPTNNEEELQEHLCGACIRGATARRPPWQPEIEEEGDADVPPPPAPYGGTLLERAASSARDMLRLAADDRLQEHEGLEEVRVVQVAAAHPGREPMLLADTGATHELHGVRHGELPEEAIHSVNLVTATGTEKASMTPEGIVYVETNNAIQPLFPLGSYILECGVKWVWNDKMCDVVLPNGDRISLIQLRSSIYIREADAEVLRGLRRSLRGEALRVAVHEARAAVVTMVQLEEHRRLGHPHFLAECRECRMAAGRMRPHFRLNPDMRAGGELSVDMSGPHYPCGWPTGDRQDETRRATYFLLGAYQTLTKAEADERRQQMEDARINSRSSQMSGCEPLIYSEDDVKRSRVLYYTVLLEGKTGEEVLKGLQKIVTMVHNDFHAPVVCRIHGDKAPELTGPNVKEYFGKLPDGGVLVTSTAGFEPNANGRAEAGIGGIKTGARTNLMAVRKADRGPLWGCSVQHTSWSQRQRALGRPSAPCAFGDRVTVRIKTDRLPSFDNRARERIFLGAADNVSHGFVVGYKQGGYWKFEISTSFVVDKTALQVGDVDTSVPVPPPMPAAAEPAGDAVKEESDKKVKEEAKTKEEADKKVKDEAKVEEELPKEGEDRDWVDLGGPPEPPAHADRDPFEAPDEQITCPRCNGQHRPHTRDSHCRLGPGAQWLMVESDVVEEDPLAEVQVASSSVDASQAFDDTDDAPPEYQEIIKESGMQLLSAREVKATVGAEREGWKLSCQNELDSWRSKGTFDPVPKEIADKLKPWEILPMKTVHGIKEDLTDSGYRRKKVRGVCCGNYQQKTGPEDLYTDNVDVSTVRTAVAAAALNGWSMGALDVKTAFLNAELPDGDKPVYMRPPPLFVSFGLVQPDEIWVARKAIYGLRISPKAWGLKRDSEMRKVRFSDGRKKYRLIRSNVDASMWVIVEDNHNVRCDSLRTAYGYILTYVDDYLYTAGDGIVGQVERFVQNLWECSVQPMLHFGTLGKLHYLGIVIEGREDGYALQQHAYIGDLLDKWGMATAQPVGSIDIESYEEEETSLDNREVDPKEVRLAQRMSGGLLWLSGRTRADIAYAVSRVSSQSTVRPAWALRLGKRILRYLIGTKLHVLLYKPVGKRGKKPLLEVYADASFDPCRAQTGYVVYFAGMLIDWRSTKQPQVARSTGEAELTALATALLALEGAEALLVTMFLIVTCHLYGDNEASISMSHGQNSWRSRALCNRSAGLKSRINDGSLTLSYVGTADQKADGLTKFLSVPLLSKARIELRIVVA